MSLVLTIPSRGLAASLRCLTHQLTNPFAVAIARFRLLLAALRTCGVMRLANSPAFHVNLACGDSLYHGRQRQQMLGDDWTDEAHYFAAEDAPALRRMLRDGTYHCVVANPPYITPKDRAANQAYRKLYPKTCHRQYSLAVPFMERIYRLAVPGGFTGQITANSFMKREFGKKLVEEFLPQIDVTHVVDTSGAYIPGHGTPTVILFGRHRKPVADTIRTVMGIRGEPSTPDDPSQGSVWTAIADQIDSPRSESEFVSAADSPRKSFHSHPWSIGGGGAAELKERMDDAGVSALDDVLQTLSSICITREDEAYWADVGALSRKRLCPGHRVVAIRGEDIRDWELGAGLAAVFPYTEAYEPVKGSEAAAVQKYLWRCRELLWRRKELGGDHREMGRTWWEWNRFLSHWHRIPRSISYGETSTHNHFVFVESNEYFFTRSSPTLKLHSAATRSYHESLTALLNSSAAAFWLKQVCQRKGSSGIGRGVYDESWETHFQFDGSKLKRFPLPGSLPTDALAEQLVTLSQELSQHAPSAVLHHWTSDENLLHKLSTAREERQRLLHLMIFHQEELDWECYRLYGLLEENLTYGGEPFPLAIGERAFEIFMARRIARGGTPTTWFERHGAKPISAPPEHWPQDYVDLYHRRHEIMQENRNIGLIEQPEYKRRWNTESWDAQLERALRHRLMDRLESYLDFDGRLNDKGQPTARLDIALASVAKMADAARQDTDFLEVGEVYRDDPAFDVERLVAELVAAENVPLLPVLRYKPTGLRKRAEWEKTWELQRREDAIDARKDLPKDDAQHLTENQAIDLKQREIGEIPAPPKYKSSDFISTSGARYWHLRGKLDVPKERWVSFPHCEGEDGTLVMAWAGYDHLQLARAVSAYYVDIQERIGGRDDPRLEPLLACLIELLPWLKQWHNEVDPEFNVPMGDYFEGFIQDEARQMNKTVEEVRNWQPPKKRSGRKRK